MIMMERPLKQSGIVYEIVLSQFVLELSIIILDYSEAFDRNLSYISALAFNSCYVGLLLSSGVPVYAISVLISMPLSAKQ